jgi:hypothetical protein
VKSACTAFRLHMFLDDETKWVRGWGRDTQPSQLDLGQLDVFSWAEPFS